MGSAAEDMHGELTVGKLLYFFYFCFVWHGKIGFMEIPILSADEFSKRYIEPFAKDVVRLASEGDEEANRILGEITGLRFPVGCIAPNITE